MCIRRVGVVLLAVAACNRPKGQERDGPLTIERYEVLELRPQELDAAMRRGDTIQLVLGGERLQLQLRPKNLVAAGCTVTELREQPVTTPCPTDLGTYAGAIVNKNQWSQARLSITPEGVMGAIRTDDVTWMIEPLRDTTGTLPAGTVRHIAYRTDDVSGRLYFEGARDSGNARQRKPARKGSGNSEALRGEDNERPCDPEDRPCEPTRSTGGGTPPPPAPLRLLGIAMAADRQYVDQARLGTAFVQRQAATLNMVDGMYRHEGIATFQIEAVIADPLDRFFGSFVSGDLLNAVQPAFAAANLDISVPAVRVARNISTGFLTSGKPPDGIILGVADLPGIAGMAFQDFTYGIDPGTAQAIALKNWMVMAHELGHIYNGVHAEADWFCRFWFMYGIWCWNSARTIMWESYSFRTSPEFSRGLVDASHNNARRLRMHIPTRVP